MNYPEDPEEWAMERQVEKDLELLKIQKAQIEERIEELETQLAASAYSVSQIKEDTNG